MYYNNMNIANKLMIFFQGNIRLWKSFWLIGEIAYPIFLFIIIFYIEIKLYNNAQVLLTLPFSNANMPIINYYKLHIISKIFYFVLTIFVTVGIWRSAEKYKGNIIWILISLIYLSYFRIFTLRLIFY